MILEDPLKTALRIRARSVFAPGDCAVGKIQIARFSFEWTCLPRTTVRLPHAFSNVALCNSERLGAEYSNFHRLPPVFNIVFECEGGEGRHHHFIDVIPMVSFEELFF